MTMVYAAKDMKNIVVSTLLDSGTVASQIEILVYAKQNTDTCLKRKSQRYTVALATLMISQAP
jgi:hypothetical protein